MMKTARSEEIPDGLNERVIAAAEAALRHESAVSAFDVLTRMGWLYPGHVDLWLRRHPSYPHIEAWMQSRRPRRVNVIRHFEAWAQAAGLVRVPQRYLPKTLWDKDQELQITPDGDPAMEALYRTAFARPETAAKRSDQAASAEPAKTELVAFTVFREEPCQECGRELVKGDLVVMDGMRPVCLACADLDHLVFLPSGDAALTRRARKHSALSVVVLEFNRRRRIQQRRGLLVTSAGLEKAETECLADEEVRARRRERALIRRQALDAGYVARVTACIQELFPRCPRKEAVSIAEHTCVRGSGRIGRSAAAKEQDAEAITLAVRAHIRHAHTSYDELLASGIDRDSARAQVREAVDDMARAWARPG